MLAVVLVLPQALAVTGRHILLSPVDDTDWSSSRRAAYRALIERGGLPEPIGELRLPAGEASYVEVPILAGTGEAALTLGAGHLSETALPDGDGNIAIAGHRDGYFRALRRLRNGDRLVLESSAGARTFEITDTQVVAPEDVWVLEPTADTVLTLITCHPFYFVGSAPDRYVVRARLLPAPAAAGAIPLDRSESNG